MPAGFIVNGSEFNGQENQDIILRPIFIGENVAQRGFRTVLSVKSSVKLTFFDKRSKILRAYADGFQGGASANKRQKKFVLEEFKAEAQYSKQEYKDTILEEITGRGGVDQNDITGTDVHNAEVSVFMRAVEHDVFMIFWLGKSDKKVVDNNVANPTFGQRIDTTGDAIFGDDGLYDDTGLLGDDIRYNITDGIWTCIEDEVGSGDNKILRITLDNNTVAQTEIQTLTSITGGTIDITINSVSYTEAFDTNSDTTFGNWVTSHAANILALSQVTATNTGTGETTFVSSVSGQRFDLVTVSAGTGGSFAETGTVANTPAQDLAVDEAIDTMKTMLTTAPKVMKNKVIKPLLNYYVTDTFLENYQETLEADGTEQAHTKTVEGIERFTYRGIPLLPMQIDEFLEDDFITPFPHRAILTMPDNLVLVLNGATDVGQTRFWFNEDENENRQRTQFEMGTGFFLPEMMVVAF